MKNNIILGKIDKVCLHFESDAINVMFTVHSVIYNNYKNVRKIFYFIKFYL